MSRLQKSYRNLTFGTLGHFFGYFLNFITRKVFIVFLSIEYLGLNGLFSNILSLLTFAELGIGTAICYSLYKPLAFQQIEKIQALMQLYRKAYTVIGAFIIVVGIGLTPLLPLILGEIPNIPHINLIYVLFVLNSGVSYFLSYKRTLLIADQKKYIDSAYYYGFQTLKYFLQIVVLILTKDYILFLSIMLAMTLVENISISKKVDSLYPYLKRRGSYILKQEETLQIKKNVFALMFHKFGSVIVNGTDNILIVAFVNLASAGLYANYVMITSALNHTIGVIYSSISASIGNLAAESNLDKQLRIFKQLDFVTAWIVGFSSICLFCLFNPFIIIWLGNEYIFPLPYVFVIVVNFYIYGMLRSVRTFNASLGLFWYDRFKPIFESVINLSFSVLLSHYYGFIGILLGTTISAITTCLWFEPYILFKHGIQFSITKYLTTYSKFALLTFITGYVTYTILAIIKHDLQFVNFINSMIVCAILPNLVYWAVYRKSNEYHEIKQKLLKVLRKPNRNGLD